jgi:hypothetical protein
METPQPEKEQQDWLTWILRLGAGACFVGWAWQHLRWGAPYDAVLWHPDYSGWLAGWFGVSWETYVADVMTDRRILLGVRLLGVLYLVLAIIAFTATRRRYVQLACLAIGSASLAFLAYCKFVNAGYAQAVFVEQGGQVLAPCVLLLALRRGISDRWTIGLAVVAFCATFIGHGIYAIGWAPTPGHFYGLTHAVLGFEEAAADTFLKCAGFLDFLVCGALLFPKLRQPALAYAVLWGLLTSLARPVAGMSTALPWWGADQFLHEAVYRAPHVALPLFLFLVCRSRKWINPEHQTPPLIPLDSHKSQI